MIAGVFHEGSGLGNQLHRYVATRCLALEKGYNFSMYHSQNFKGNDFMNLEMGKAPLFPNLLNQWREEKITNEDGNDVRTYDKSIKDVDLGTLIDGEFQAPEYFESHLDEIREWLNIRPPFGEVTSCVINFRGGEYVGVPDLFLPKEYWKKAIEEMLRIDPNMIFEVHTDDPITAKKFFPDYPIISDVETNWRAVRYAPYLILSNSSFAILPALLNENVKKILAPLYWAGYNKGYWQLPQNNYKQFTYIHHED